MLSATVALSQSVLAGGVKDVWVGEHRSIAVRHGEDVLIQRVCWQGVLFPLERHHLTEAIAFTWASTS